MSGLNPLVIRNRAYGHYNPGRPLPTPGSAVAKTFAAVAENSLCGANDVHTFLLATADALPSFKKVTDEMGKGSVRIVLDGNPVPTLVGYPDGGRCITLPFGQRPSSYLPTLFNICASLLPAPDGVVVPPNQPVGTFEEIHHQLWQGFFWRTVLCETFLFEMAHEIHAAGMVFLNSSGRDTFLSATDLALFRIMRREGLNGMARAYPFFMDPDRQRMLNELLITQAERLAAGAAAVSGSFRWEPLPDVELPTLPRTHIDDLADEQGRYETGMYTRNGGATEAFLQSSIEVVKAQLQQPFTELRQLHYLLDLIEALAPELATIILKSHAGKDVRYVLTRNELGQPAIMMGTAADMFGRSSTPPDIHIHIGSTLGEMLKSLVMIYARMAIPKGFHDGITLPMNALRQKKAGELAKVLERINARNEMWGYSAFFEFVFQAERRGVNIPFSAHHQWMLHILEKCGFEVFCDRWTTFADPVLLGAMRARFAEMAREILASQSAAS